VGPLLRHEPAAARKTRAASEPARETTETESESESESETIGAEESGLDGHGGPKKKKIGAAAESESESGGGLDGHGVPEKKKKTGGARGSGSESGFCGRALQQTRCPGGY
jgi:hypothetical protein